MYQLVYVSTATRPFKNAELAELLEKSRSNNAADDVTGMLLYHDGNFFQVLEGDYDAVTRVFRRVERDPRHQAVSVIYEDESDEPAFGEWSMAWCEVNESTLEEVPGFSDLMLRRGQDQPFGTDPQMVHDMILTFRDNAR